MANACSPNSAKRSSASVLGGREGFGQLRLGDHDHAPLGDLEAARVAADPRFGNLHCARTMQKGGAHDEALLHGSLVTRLRCSDAARKEISVRRCGT